MWENLIFAVSIQVGLYTSIFLGLIVVVGFMIWDYWDRNYNWKD